MISRLIAIPLFVGFLYTGYNTYLNPDFSLYMIPFSIGLVLLYLFSPQIDWQWYKRNPPQMSQEMRLMFNQKSKFYQPLSADEKTRYRDRIGLYLMANDFMPMGAFKEGDGVPMDIRTFIAAAAVRLSFGKEDFLMSKFERIIVYPGAFPSPQYPENYHASEIYEEDGVVMLSANHIMEVFFQPTQFYNVAIHEYSKVFMKSYKEWENPQVGENFWEELEQISGMSKDYIHQFINLPEIDPIPVSIHHFFKFPEKFVQVLPKIFEKYKIIFNQDPLNAYQPVLEPKMLMISQDS